MVFSSVSFLFFFLPAVVLFSSVTKNIRIKNYILLVFSILFYTLGGGVHLFTLLVSVCINYVCGLLCGKKEAKHRRIVLSIGIVLNVLILFFYKYLGFFVEILSIIFSFQNPQIKVLLPIGISFYTFQGMSYLIDVYRTPEIKQKNFCYLLLYIMFFPQLIAGPIVRYSDINKQFYNRDITLDKFIYGLERFIIGLSKKVLIANVLSEVSSYIFGLNYAKYTCFYAWIASVSYALQIYYDFSGYSDMAIGLGSMFGFTFEENFDYPYIASSFKEFWRRWHISLSSWFRDYVYIPLGGNRKGKSRTIFNVLFVFFLTGLWHGASWNFVLWGIINGVLVVLCDIRGSKKRDNKIHNKLFSIVVCLIKHVLTLVGIIVLWLLFDRSNVFLQVVLKMFGINFTSLGIFIEPYQKFVNTPLLKELLSIEFWLSFCFGIFFCFPWKRKLQFIILQDERVKIVCECTKYLILLVLLFFSVLSVANGAFNPFIYFRF